MLPDCFLVFPPILVCFRESGLSGSVKDTGRAFEQSKGELACFKAEAPNAWVPAQTHIHTHTLAHVNMLRSWEMIVTMNGSIDPVFSRSTSDGCETCVLSLVLFCC